MPDHIHPQSKTKTSRLPTKLRRLPAEMLTGSSCAKPANVSRYWGQPSTWEKTLGSLRNGRHACRTTAPARPADGRHRLHSRPAPAGLQGALRPETHRLEG